MFKKLTTGPALLRRRLSWVVVPAALGRVS